MKTRAIHLKDDEQVHVYFRGVRVLLIGTDHSLNGPLLLVADDQQSNDKCDVRGLDWTLSKLLKQLEN